MRSKLFRHALLTFGLCTMVTLAWFNFADSALGSQVGSVETIDRAPESRQLPPDVQVDPAKIYAANFVQTIEITGEGAVEIWYCGNNRLNKSLPDACALARVCDETCTHEFVAHGFWMLVGKPGPGQMASKFGYFKTSKGTGRDPKCEWKFPATKFNPLACVIHWANHRFHGLKMPFQYKFTPITDAPRNPASVMTVRASRQGTSALHWEARVKSLALPFVRSFTIVCKSPDGRSKKRTTKRRIPTRGGGVDQKYVIGISGLEAGTTYDCLITANTRGIKSATFRTRTGTLGGSGAASSGGGGSSSSGGSNPVRPVTGPIVL